MSLISLLLVAGTVEVTAHDLTLKGPGSWTFDAKLIEPDKNRSGLTIVMIGGGISNDLNWTVPGTIEVNDRPIQLTINGKTHQDAPAIASAMADEGHAVLHYSTIAHEDPKREQWPLEITAHAPQDLLLLQKSATDLARTHPATRNDRLILLGHSMGAQRACAQAATDRNIDALILLGPAQMTRTGPEDPGRNLNRAAARTRLLELDRDGDGLVKGEELPADVDFDQNGELQEWEASAVIALQERKKISGPSRADQHGIPFGEDSLASRDIPALALYGELDNAQGHHAPVLQSLVDQGSLNQLEIKVLPDLGHQMSPQEGPLAGPVSTTAIQQIVAWISDLRKVDESPSAGR